MEQVVVDGIVRIPLQRFEDDRGWFYEVRRESALPHATVQTNVSFSRKGTIRGLHFHERGQDDLFACLQGTARVVVLDRVDRRHVHGGHRRRQPGRDLRSRASTRTASRRSPISLFCYHVTREYDPADPDEQGLCWADPRIKALGAPDTPILSPRDAADALTATIVTGAAGQLGNALLERFPEAQRADARRSGT